MTEQQKSQSMSFLAVLVDDVQQALDRVNISDTASDRRNLLRTIISTVEGVSWVYRNHILSIARDLMEISPVMDMAFAEKTFFVSEKGEVSEQYRRLSITAMIRLATSLAKEVCPNLLADFGDSKWENLKAAIAMRNKITHPKSIDDLSVSKADIQAAREGFFWFLDLSINAMEQTQQVLAEHVGMAAELLRDLKAGDPDALGLIDRFNRGLQN